MFSSLNFVIFFEIFFAMVFVRFDGKYINIVNIVVAIMRETPRLTGGLSDDEVSLE